MVPTVDMRVLLEKGINQMGVEGLAEVTRVPITVITTARLGHSISPRNWQKLETGLATRAPAPNTRRRA